ncbi:hypothetical protein P1X15_16680 [Runella sp. MFBS21]|uniref:hypothetical protein n=1 Tax=Runella sp. MFBS21 TaxID=3034018 RepID=UPI0023F9E772|nr:hypothetical protein [Runella sp. MFBS21]MDF7819257.1 hypothetical protein [Runella sp. MFBS21]
MKYLYKILLLSISLAARVAWSHSHDDPTTKPPTSTPAAPSRVVSAQIADMDAALAALNQRMSSTTPAVDLMANLPIVVSEEVAESRVEARKLFRYLDQNPDKLIESLTPEALLTLPVGLSKSLGDNSRITVGILEAKFEKAVTKLTIFVRLNFHVSGSSEPNRELFFGAQDVTFTREGGVSGFTAALLGDFVLPMKQWTVILKGTTQPGCAGTKAEFECGEFKIGSLCAEVVFPTTVLKPNPWSVSAQT